MNKTYHEIILRKFSGFEAGEKKYTDLAAEARCVSENSHSEGNGRKVYILAPGTEYPVPGDRILDGTVERDITEVKICRDIAGSIRAVRCTTLN